MKQIKARRTGNPSPSLLSARDLVLAGVGAAAIARRKGSKSLSTLEARRRQLVQRIQQQASTIGERITDIAGSLRAQVESVAQPAIHQFESLLSRFGANTRGSTKRSAARRRPTARKSVRPPARRA
jgi:hypothetical protein